MNKLPSLLSDLTFDPDNANTHSEHGMALLESHIQADGLGRSILADKNGVIIAGNGVLEAAISAGLQRVIPVETTGNELVVVIRKDVELDSPRGRRMALADNAIAYKNQGLDEEVIRRQAQAHEIDLDSIGLSDADLAALRKKGADITEPADESQTGGGGGDKCEEGKYLILVTCPTQEDQNDLLTRLRGQGVQCRAMNT